MSAADEQIAALQAQAWDEGYEAHRKFANRPRGEWFFTSNPYRSSTEEADRG